MEHATYSAGTDEPANKFAAFISFLLNPLFLAPPMFALIMQTDPVAREYGTSLMLWVLFYYTLVPFLILVTYRLLNRIETLEIRNQHRRHGPFLLGILSYLGGYLTAISILGFSGPVQAAAFTLLCSSTLAAIINIKWKISIHSSAVSISAVFLVWSIYTLQLSELFIASWLFGILAMVLMCWSRINLDAHSPGQAVAGILFGLVVGLLVLLFYPL